MDSKTSHSILAKVKALREKKADLGSPASGLDSAAQIYNNTLGTTPPPVSPGIGAALALGLGASGAINGAGYGGLLGLGYGSAKGRPVAGAARGAGRGALTVGGAGLGAGTGMMLANQLGGNVGGLALGGLLGGVGGGLLGNRAANKVMGKDLKSKEEKESEKQAFDPTNEAFSDALQQMSASQLKTDALHDVRNVGLAALGGGIAGRGLLGLVQTLRANKRKKTRSGPSYLPLPFPAIAKTANFLEGDYAANKAGIPWYGPAMMLGGLGGLGLGWHGMDKILNQRRERAMKGDLESARQQFHDALVGQYSEPVKMHPKLIDKKAADADPTMVKVGEALDTLFDSFEREFAKQEKKAIDWQNLAGAATGGYGMYAGLSSLMAGAYLYDKMKKRGRGAILDKALQKRQRRKFMQSPNEIYAVPEPALVE